LTLVEVVCPQITEGSRPCLATRGKIKVGGEEKTFRPREPSAGRNTKLRAGEKTCAESPKLTPSEWVLIGGGGKKSKKGKASKGEESVP